MTETQSSDATAWDTLSGVDGSSGKQPISEEEEKDKSDEKVVSSTEEEVAKIMILANALLVS